MRKRNDIPSDIGDYLKYDETSKTGLRWKKLYGNSRCVSIGDEAGYLNKKQSYYRTKFNNKLYTNHRIIYFLHYSYCPDCIDHIDNDKSNNNISNLREATFSNNQQNRTINKNSTTRVKGLSIIRKTYWQLRIWKNNKIAFLEYYKLSEKTKDECRIILENKRKEFHGQFANHG